MRITVSYFKPMGVAPGWAANVFVPGHPPILLRGRDLQGYRSFQAARKAALRYMRGAPPRGPPRGWPCRQRRLRSSGSAIRPP